jgi:hypothetical protein
LEEKGKGEERKGKEKSVDEGEMKMALGRERVNWIN